MYNGTPSGESILLELLDSFLLLGNTTTNTHKRRQTHKMILEATEQKNVALIIRKEVSLAHVSLNMIPNGLSHARRRTADSRVTEICKGSTIELRNA